ncbi:MAG: solute carrier family 26 protein [Balneolales bacterium]
MPNHSKLYQYLPFLDWIRTYSTDELKGDMNAGLTLGVMMIPQGMAYAVLAGLPPVYGLYASLVPLIIYSFLGTFRQRAVGPIALVSILIAAGVGNFAEPESERFIQLAIMTAFGVGIIQLLMGVFRMGFVVNFFSYPVLSGFTSAAALIIGVSQIPNLLGIDLSRVSHVHEIMISIFQRTGEIEPLTAAIGTGSVTVIILLLKWKRTFPSALVVVAAGTLVTAYGGLETHGVSIIGDVPEGLPSFGISGFNLGDLQMLLPVILVISLISYMESIAIAKTISSKRGYKIDPNQELIALGASNLGGSFFQAFPTTGGLSRTALSDQAGARTGLSSLISAVIIILTLLFLTPYFYYLPESVLAAIIMVAVIGMLDLREMHHLWKTDKIDLSMLLITFFATLILGIVEGIITGVVISLIAVIYSSTKPHSAELGRLSAKTFRNIRRYPEADVDADVLIFRFDSPLYFANVEHFRDTLEALIEKKGEDLRLVILDAAAINNIDSTGIHMMEKLVRDLKMKRIALYISSAIGPVRDKLKISGITAEIGEDHFFFDVSDALSYYRQGKGKYRAPAYPPIQTNI